jgi:hypothetical protein
MDKQEEESYNKGVKLVLQIFKNILHNRRDVIFDKTTHFTYYKFHDSLYLIPYIRDTHYKKLKQRLFAIDLKKMECIDSLDCIHVGLDRISSEKLFNIKKTVTKKEEYHSNVLSSEPFNIYDLISIESHFKAFCSWVSGIVEYGIGAIIIQQEIERYHKHLDPITNFLLYCLLKYDFTNIIELYLEYLEKNCQYSGKVHYPSLIANLKKLFLLLIKADYINYKVKLKWLNFILNNFLDSKIIKIYFKELVKEIDFLNNNNKSNEFKRIVSKSKIGLGKGLKIFVFNRSIYSRKYLEDLRSSIPIKNIRNSKSLYKIDMNEYIKKYHTSNSRKRLSFLIQKYNTAKELERKGKITSYVISTSNVMDLSHFIKYYRNDFDYFLITTHSLHFRKRSKIIASFLKSPIKSVNTFLRVIRMHCFFLINKKGEINYVTFND